MFFFYYHYFFATFEFALFWFKKCFRFARKKQFTTTYEALENCAKAPQRCLLFCCFI